MTKKLIVMIVALSATGLIALFGIGVLLASQQGARPAIGTPAPDFSMPLYKNYRANLPATTRLADLRGKVVIVNFWASWCVECVKEADVLEATWRQYKDRGLIVLGVDYLDTEAAATNYLEQFNTTYPIGVDLQESVSHLYRITGVPETFIIDKKGNIRKITIQAVTAQDLNSTVESLLAE